MLIIGWTTPLLDSWVCVEHKDNLNTVVFKMWGRKMQLYRQFSCQQKSRKLTPTNFRNIFNHAYYRWKTKGGHLIVCPWFLVRIKEKYKLERQYYYVSKQEEKHEIVTSNSSTLFVNFNIKSRTPLDWHDITIQRHSTFEIITINVQNLPTRWTFSTETPYFYICISLYHWLINHVYWDL